MQINLNDKARAAEGVGRPEKIEVPVAHLKALWRLWDAASELIVESPDTPDNLQATFASILEECAATRGHAPALDGVD